MASIDNPFNVVNVKSVSLPGSHQTVMIWEVVLLSSSDTLTVPALSSTSGAKSLTSGVTATNSTASDEGNASVTITGGVKGTKAVIATLHVSGRANVLSQDEDPT